MPILLKPQVTAELLTKLLMQEFIRPIYWYATMPHMLKDHKRRAMYLTSDWPSNYGIEKISDTESKALYRKDNLPYVPKKDRILIWKYHAWWIYIERNLANWLSRCQGHTETFYCELPKVAFKVMSKAVYEGKYQVLFPSVFFTKNDHKRQMIMKYSQQQHKLPTHVNMKFYNWLSAICAKSLLIE